MSQTSDLIGVSQVRAAEEGGWEEVWIHHSELGKIGQRIRWAATREELTRPAEPR